jgi:general secretion pathway protein D
MNMKLSLSCAVIVMCCSACAAMQPDLLPSAVEPAPATQDVSPAVPEDPAAVPDMLQLSSADADVQKPAPVRVPDVAPAQAVKKKEPRAQAPVRTPVAAADQNPAAPAAAQEMISLNFDDADIYEVVNALSDFLGVNFIIDQRVKGKVNIHTAGEIDKRRLLPIMETIFEMNNIAMIEYGDFYKIIPIKEAKQQIVDFSIGRELARVPSYDRQMIHIVPLRYVTAKDAEALVKRFLGPGGDVFEYPKGNLVVIIDRAATIRKVLRMINEIDIDLFAYNQVRFFKVDNANARDVADELAEIFTAIGLEATPEKGVGLKFIPVERVGGVLAVSSNPDAFERVERWLEVLDTVDDEASEQVFIYFVENGKAEEIGDVITQIYESTSGSTRTRDRDVQSRTRQDARTRTQQAQTTRRTQTGIGNEQSALLEGDVKIVVDTPTNSIIVRAIARDYEIIKRTMIQLDRIPRQVLIEVLIAEVTLGGDTKFGIEWSLLSEGEKLGGYRGDEMIGIRGTPLDTLGFSYVFDGDFLNVFLQAQASQNKLNILSSPHILAVDNKEARIEVGEEVPIVTSEYVPLDIDDSDSTSRSIEYRSTGIILTVTPRINERGLVAMDLSQEVSEAVLNEVSGIQSPVITNRKAETSLVVQDGQTIILGGLISEKGTENKSGVPFLSSIPLIGNLFGSTSTTRDKVELILLITPRVVTNFEEVDLITDEIKVRVGNIRRLINRSDDYWDAYKDEE